MGQSRELSNPAPAKYPSDDGQGFEEDLGATGVFGTMPPRSVEIGPDLTETAGQAGSEAPGEIPPHAPAVPGLRDNLQEPFVHKIVVGGSSQTFSGDLLKLLRTNPPEAGSVAAEPTPNAWSSPSPAATGPTGPSSGPTSDGFTQLLRTLGSDASSARTTMQPEDAHHALTNSASNHAPPDAAFTALLSAESSRGLSDAHGPPIDRQELASSGPTLGDESGFTALLKGFSGSSASPGERRSDTGAVGDAYEKTPPPHLAGAHSNAGALSASGQDAPGVFTQLFSTLTPAASRSGSIEEAATVEGLPGTPSGYSKQTPLPQPSGDGASFTRLISTLEQPSSGNSPFGHEESSQFNTPTLQTSPEPAEQAAESRTEMNVGSVTSFPPSQPRTEALSGDGDLTRLIQSLDGPAKGSEIQAGYSSTKEHPAPSSPRGLSFTDLHKMLDSPAETVLPLPPPDVSSSARKLSATQPFTTLSGGGSVPNVGQSAQALPNLPSGPSEVTIIRDASRFREMQRTGSAGQTVGSSVPSSQSLPVPFSPPASPALPNLQWPPQVQPNPSAVPPMQFGSGMPVQQNAPAAPAPFPPSPAAMLVVGKMQQYLPLLLIIIIFLLVLILVTILFLLKR